jgi:polar amino acid transport system substrate-binding protein
MNRATHFAGLELEYISLPWERAQKIVEEETDSIIFTLAKTPEREERYLWIETIHQVKDGLYALASRDDIVIESVDDVYKYSIALPIGDVSLRKLKILPDHADLLFMVSSQEQAIIMLIKGRTELNYNNDVGFLTAIDSMGFPRQLFKVIYVTSRSEMGIATNKKTDPALVERLRRGIDTLRKNGEYAALQKKWFGTQ